MKVIGKIALFFVVAIATGLTGCSTQSKSLPRASERVMAEYEEAGDRVFRDTASESTYRLHSLMIVKDDEVVYEKWAVGHSPEQLHILWSASKTFTALAVGFAEQERLLTTDDRVVDFFVSNELPSHKNKWLEDITLHHLLTMSSGLGDDYSLRQIRNGLGDWARETLSMQHYFAPGEMYHYSSMDTYLLSVIVSKVTGRKLMDYLAEKLFEPLGIDDYYWEESPQGYNVGGWGLYLTTESLAKAGLFMLHRGEWNGKRLLAEEWFDKAMSPQIMQYKGRENNPESIEQLKRTRNQWNQGYGYQMWCCIDGAYRMDGAWGQTVIIHPEKNAVVVTTAHASNGKTILESIWNNVFTKM